jgi:hypothetical protein
MLFIESAEGGAGVLRRLHDEPEALANAARAAIEVIHFDADTGKDLRRAPGAREDCGQGCYDCLLSYTNQRDHTTIDRHATIDLLFRLSVARTAKTTAKPPPRPGASSELERRFLAFLKGGGYRLPDQSSSAIADFAYHLPAGNVAVFVGDAPDAEAVNRLFDEGWLVISFGHDTNEWEGAVRMHRGVFGIGRG